MVVVTGLVRETRRVCWRTGMAGGRPILQKMLSSLPLCALRYWGLRLGFLVLLTKSHVVVPNTEPWGFWAWRRRASAFLARMFCITSAKLTDRWRPVGVSVGVEGGNDDDVELLAFRA